MKLNLKTAHKVSLGLFAGLTAVVLCTLPFCTVQKDTIYLYTSGLKETSREEGFIRELKQLGYRVNVNSKQMPTKDSIGFWFKPPTYAKYISASQAKYNFIYNEDYYPFDWRGMAKLPIALTPYQDVYEHYMRANVKTALFTLGVNEADFYPRGTRKIYQLIYYGDNTHNSLIGEMLLNQENVRFLGRFWPKDNRTLPVSEKESGRCDELSKAEMVVIPAEIGTADGKRISAEIMEAVACGALVISPENPILKQMYGNSIVYYSRTEDFLPLVAYYLNNQEIMKEKTTAAHKITRENLSSAAAARRFKELVEWLKNNS